MLHLSEYSLAYVTYSRLFTSVFHFQEYSFQGAMLLYGGLVLHGLPAAMLFRPSWFYGPTTNNQLPHKEINEKQTEMVFCEHADIQTNNNDSDSVIGKSSISNVMSTETKCHYLSVSQTLLPHVDKNSVSSRYSLDGRKSRTWTSRSTLEHMPFQHPLYATEKEEDAKEGQSSKYSLWEWSLLKNPLCVIFVFGYAFGHAGYNHAIIFLAPFCHENGMTLSSAAFIMSIYGGSDLVGRMLGGWFGGFNFIKRSNIIVICFTLIGIYLIVLTFYRTYWNVVGFSVTIGFFGGIYFAQVASVVVDFLGLDKLSPGMGLGITIYGIISVPLPIMLGECHIMNGILVEDFWQLWCEFLKHTIRYVFMGLFFVP